MKKLLALSILLCSSAFAERDVYRPNTVSDDEYTTTVEIINYANPSNPRRYFKMDLEYTHIMFIAENQVLLIDRTPGVNCPDGKLQVLRAVRHKLEADGRDPMQVANSIINTKAICVNVMDKFGLYPTDKLGKAKEYEFAVVSNKTQELIISPSPGYWTCRSKAAKAQSLGLDYFCLDSSQVFK
jgi:hypothetical protein